MKIFLYILTIFGFISCGSDQYIDNLCDSYFPGEADFSFKPKRYTAKQIQDIEYDRIVSIYTNANSSCSGFILHGSYVLTNAHCILPVVRDLKVPLSRHDQLEMRKLYVKSDQHLWTQVKVIDYAYEPSVYDFALLKILPTNQEINPEDLNLFLVKLNLSCNWHESEAFLYSWFMEFREMRYGFILPKEENHSRLLHSIKSMPGTSGSAIFNSFGEIIAIHQGQSKFLPDSPLLSSTIGLATPLSAIYKLSQPFRNIVNLIHQESLK